MQQEKNQRLSCYSFFETTVQKYADVVAIWSREGVYTWREAHDRVCQYAAYFLELGVRPGDLVAFYLENSPEFLFAWLGLFAIGISYSNSRSAVVEISRRECSCNDQCESRQ